MMRIRRRFLQFMVYGGVFLAMAGDIIARRAASALKNISQDVGE